MSLSCDHPGSSVKGNKVDGGIETCSFCHATRSYPPSGPGGWSEGKENVIQYCRSSDRREDLDGQVLDNKKAIERDGYWCDQVFQDFNVSGDTTSRDDIDLLLRLAPTKGWKRLYITELTRIGRSQGFIHATVEKLASHGILVVLSRRGVVLDSTTLEGKVLIGGLALGATIELELTRERNLRGRETMKRKGISGGRPRMRALSDAAILAVVEKHPEWSMTKVAANLGCSKATMSRRFKTLGIETIRAVPGRISETLH